MKIGINVSWMTPGSTGGMEWYARGLIEHLAKMDKTNEYLLVVGPMNYRTFAKPGANWKVFLYEGVESTPSTFLFANTHRTAASKNQGFRFARKIYAKLRSFYRCSMAPVHDGSLADLLDWKGVDVWFCPFMYSLPIDTKVPIVNTIPDLQHEYYPELFNEEELRFRTAGYQYSCKAAAATIAISEATAQDISHIYSIDPKKVFATPLSLDPSFLVTPDFLKECVRQVRVKYRLEDEYVYFPANGWPHKNHLKLAEAMHYVRKKGINLKLILTGVAFDLIERMNAVLDKYGLHDCVQHLGYVDRQDVIGLYGGAKMLAFPSTFEGFGIPLLEAMAIGTPVVCSNVTSLPEVGGDVPLYFDPEDPESIADSIVRVTSDEDLRSRMIDAGKKQVKQFSYEETAKQTHAIFEKIVNGELKNPQLPPPRGLMPWNWLCDGHSRWYFHCRNLKEVCLKVVQHTDHPGLSGQRIRVLLNEKVMAESSLDPGRELDLGFAPEDLSPDGFYCLDVCASIKMKINNQILSARVLEIRIVDENQEALRLV